MTGSLGQFPKDRVATVRFGSGYGSCMERFERFRFSVLTVHPGRGFLGTSVACYPKGPNLENIQSRLKFSISLEIFNLDLQNSPPNIGGWWVACLKIAISLINVKILKIFKIWALRVTDLVAPYCAIPRDYLSDTPHCALWGLKLFDVSTWPIGCDSPSPLF